MQHWQDRPDPLAPLIGRELELSGHGDGRWLHVTEPFRATLAVSPAGSLPSGSVTLTGELIEPAGKRNPGGFDYRAFLAARGVRAQVLVRDVTVTGPRAGLRDRLRASVRTGLGEREAALVEAMTLGVRDELGDLRDSFGASGMAHLLALSGLHLGVLVVALQRVLGGRRGYRTLVISGVVFGYVALTGVTPSMLRAAIMAFVLLLGDAAGTGRVRAPVTMALAVLITLLLYPAWLFDLGFQLSYGAVIGILVAAGPVGAFVRAAQGVPDRVIRLTVAAGLTSLAAQLPTMSVVASAFGQVPAFAAIPNIVAVPLAGLLVPLGNLAGLIGLVSGPAAAVINTVNGLLAGALIRLAETTATLPSVPWGEVGAAGHTYWLVGCLAACLAVLRVLRPWRALLVALAALLAAGVTPPPHPAPELVALDVGQGDSFVLRFPGGTTVLVDAGGSVWSDFDTGARIVVPALRAMGVGSLDLVIATHADADHAGGLINVLESMPVQALAIGHDEPERELFVDLLQAADRVEVPVLRVRRGEELRLGDATLLVLNPGQIPSGVSNDDSVAVAVGWRGEYVAVLPAEVSAAVEARLYPPPAGVLVVPHHGSRFSSSDGFLRAVAGHTAVISVGRNNFGHPHEDVLHRLADRGYSVHTTLERGAVRLPLCGRC